MNTKKIVHSITVKKGICKSRSALTGKQVSKDWLQLALLLNYLASLAIKGLDICQLTSMSQGAVNFTLLERDQVTLFHCTATKRSHDVPVTKYQRIGENDIL